MTYSIYQKIEGRLVLMEDVEGLGKACFHVETYRNRRPLATFVIIDEHGKVMEF